MEKERERPKDRGGGGERGWWGWGRQRVFWEQEIFVFIVEEMPKMNKSNQYHFRGWGPCKCYESYVRPALDRLHWG